MSWHDVAFVWLFCGMGWWVIAMVTHLTVPAAVAVACILVAGLCGRIRGD
jgi:hypothetical protein